jgi:hypothetical protein
MKSITHLFLVLTFFSLVSCQTLSTKQLNGKWIDEEKSFAIEFKGNKITLFFINENVEGEYLLAKNDKGYFLDIVFEYDTMKIPIQFIGNEIIQVQVNCPWIKLKKSQQMDRVGLRTRPAI